MEDAELLTRAEEDGPTLLDRILEELGRIDDDTTEELSLTDEELTRAEDDATLLDRETEAELPTEEERTDTELLGRALAELLRRTLEFDRTAEDDAALLDRTADEERREDEEEEARVDEDERALESDTTTLNINGSPRLSTVEARTRWNTLGTNVVPDVKRRGNTSVLEATAAIGAKVAWPLQEMVPDAEAEAALELVREAAEELPRILTVDELGCKLEEIRAADDDVELTRELEAPWEDDIGAPLEDAERAEELDRDAEDETVLLERTAEDNARLED
ncbi:hypothetical protein R3P38DRAFT_3173773 [Favolaschia claudopus]|uniref:Uncharacterized protein n=1 Tax=Favolaschia claudopus TaxID=2862362 RepID=A0AAW0DCC0_9AGAR